MGDAYPIVSKQTIQIIHDLETAKQSTQEAEQDRQDAHDFLREHGDCDKLAEEKRAYCQYHVLIAEDNIQAADEMEDAAIKSYADAFGEAHQSILRRTTLWILGYHGDISSLTH